MPCSHTLDPDAAYRALQARDARFDGRLFVGVTSTGIYCRPVCRVRLPRPQNCRFFGHAAQAEAQGFRPCLRCRPELAPGLSLADSSANLADHAARLLAQLAQPSGSQAAAASSGPAQLPALAQVAARLGVTDRHLRRIFQARHGVSPQAWLGTQRLLLAKQLLTDTTWPVTEVALASGFGSLRRLQAAFVQSYRLSPAALRRGGGAAGEARPGPTADSIRLGYRPPLDAASLLGFTAARALPGQELVQGLSLRRTLSLPQPGSQPGGAGWLQGWIQATLVPERCELHLQLDAALRPALPLLLQRARHAFDLDAEPASIDAALATVPGPDLPGLRLPGSWDGFETAVRVILDQQVTVAAARTLGARLLARFGQPVDTPWPELHRAFPTPQVLAQASDDAIGSLGIVRQRVRAIQALAQAMASGQLQLLPGADVDATLHALQALPGIGPWSAQLIALRTLGWPDAWPASDIGLLNALGTRDVAAAEQQAQAWRPWRGYAVFKLWRALEPPGQPPTRMATRPAPPVATATPAATVAPSPPCTTPTTTPT